MNKQRGTGGGGGGRSSGSSGRGGRHHATLAPEDKIQEIGIRSKNSVAIAVEGCCHGSIRTIYERLRQNHTKIDLLLCCGDFESLRTPADFHSIVAPSKFRELGSFYEYYSGKRTAPILTIIIGGNHEASQPLAELYYGGWVAPNIYYLGAAGVVNYRGIRIGGISGIYKSEDHIQSRFEVPPYNNSTIRSIFHYRNVEVYRLECLAASADLTKNRKHVNIMMSHDWPQGIEQYGDVTGLLQRNPNFRNGITNNSLGSPPAAKLLRALKPCYWFSGHMHTKFLATVQHLRGVVSDAVATRKTAPVATATTCITNESVGKESSTRNSVAVPDSDAADEAQNESSEKATIATTQFVAPENSSSTACRAQPDLTDLMTQFLALDKCLPGREYLSIVHVPVTDEKQASNDSKLEYDLEWLAVLRKTHHLSAATSKHCVNVPPHIEHTVTDAEIEWVRVGLQHYGGDITIPQNFEITVPPHIEQATGDPSFPPLPRMGNPQTDQLLELLHLEHLPNLTIPYTGWTEK